MKRICQFPNCLEFRFSQGYCKVHYRKFAMVRRKIRCKHCNAYAPNAGRLLCDRCYKYMKFHGCLNEYPLVKYNEGKLFSDTQYVVLQKWSALGALNAKEFWQQIRPDLDRLSSDRYFERIKRKIKDLQLPHVVTEEKRYGISITGKELQKFCIRRTYKLVYTKAYRQRQSSKALHKSSLRSGVHSGNGVDELQRRKRSKVSVEK